MKKTDEQKQQAAERSQHNQRRAAFKRTVKSEIKQIGVRAYELRIEYLKQNPKNPLPSPYFGHDETIELMSQALDEIVRKLNDGFESS